MKYLHVLLLLYFFHTCIYHSMSKAESFNGNTDRKALTAFKLQVTDPQKALSGWTQNTSHCTWYGVTCSRNGAGRVQSLNLTGLGLFGALSPHLSNLTSLQVLDLSNNSFYGHIPFDFNHFLHIQHIDLASNYINGTIPVGLSTCHDLRTLSLPLNNLSGSLPPELGLLERLKIFDLSINNLSGAIPPSYGNLSSLTYLALARNHLVGEIPSQLGHLQNLSQIQLSENHLTGNIPYSIFNLSSLIYLSVTKNNLSGELPNDIGHALPNLEEIYLAWNRFEGVIPSSLSNVSQINSLDLSYNYFKGPIPLLQNMNKLIYLDLGNNSFSSDTERNFQLFNSLSNCTQLEVLRLFGNRLAGELPGSVANLSSHLQHFCLDDNMLKGSFPRGIENFPNLISLSIEKNSFTGEIPKSLGSLNKLQRCALHQNKFYGEIPDIFINLTQLYFLSMGNNQFSSRIPPSIGSCQQLKLLGLRASGLHGSISKEIFSISSLSDLRLSQNSLSGPIPIEVGNLKQLQFMDVSDNQLSGNLSTSSIGKCAGLQTLLMARNNLYGSIPESIGDLASLVSLDLSSNNLSGPIPESLGKLEYLKMLNLSLNHLEGEVPTEGVFRNLTSDSFQRNNELCGATQEIARKLGISVCITKKRKRNILVPIISSVSGFTLLTSLMCGVLWALNSQKKNNKRDNSSSSFPAVKGLPPMISYYDILGATNNFAAENLIGKGGFASVFKGNFSSTGENGAYNDETTLAVKVLDLQLSKASRSFIAECDALRNVKHRNLVKMVTSCSSIDFKGEEFKALVMEFMSNGNLDQWLYPKDTESGLCLTLLQRLNIVIDVASATDYLHHDCDPPMVHCDLKPANVLLDDDMVAHVGDFGLARFISQNPSQQGNSTTALKGSIGYIAPEYGLGGKASTSGDVYSFGILLLEMIMARKPTDEMFKEGLSLKKYASKTKKKEILEIVDPRLFKNHKYQPQNTSRDYSNTSYSSNDYTLNYWLQRDEECIAFLIGIGLSCASHSAKDRITMRETLAKLQEIKKFLLSL